MATKLQLGVDVVGVCIIYFCHDETGRFVMAKRNQNTRDEHGRWDIGGGGLEFSDTVEETLRKEILEEYCTDVQSFKFLGYRDVQRIHQGKPTHWIALDFKVLVDEKKVSLGEPHKFERIAWFTRDSLPENGDLHSQLPNFLEKYQRELTI